MIRIKIFFFVHDARPVVCREGIKRTKLELQKN